MLQRIYILTHDERIFHPRLFESVLSRNPGSFEFIGAAIVRRRKTETTRSLVEHLFHLGGIYGVLRVASLLAFRRLGAILGMGGPATVRAVFDAHGIPVKEIDSPNQPDFVEWLRAQRPDIVFCAITPILKTPILQTPRLACVNRHAGKLPDYRGGEPVFHALRRREQSVTVTYHTMVEELDGGSVLWEHAESVAARDTVFSLYDRLFEASSHGFWPAMAELPNGGIRTVDLSRGATYRRPTPEEIAEFHRVGRRYV